MVEAMAVNVNQDMVADMIWRRLAGTEDLVGVADEVITIWCSTWTIRTAVREEDAVGAWIGIEKEVVTPMVEGEGRRDLVRRIATVAVNGIAGEDNTFWHLRPRVQECVLMFSSLNVLLCAVMTDTR
jgi:hypothetical protein